ncbi:uroporphyrinogen-III synthase [Entomomonas asaccharolytica]|uniref:Uroporphyrinogen-III synthase n=1 Tax=Entomomonas asaccharolytica TaxID=2785331 RepID=A0A974NEL7_9GAMM|nr:uroporphyrinogen-III synthase [Entomomonas asaccharolytica]QQP85216.1 uroporphyrinogen-III synthase [Entomomonas asaccharolytica]
MNSWRLLLTRSAPDCHSQADTLAELGITAECLPLLEIVALPETASQRSQLLDFDRYTTLVVISKPAAKLILERLDYYWPQLPIQQTWFTVGKATAEILQAANLSVHYPTLGDDSEALWQLVEFQENLANPQCRVLIIKGEEGRQWLAEKLQLSGIATETMELYRRQMPNYTEQVLWRQLTDKNINAIVISSGQALDNLQQLVTTDWQKLAEMPVFVPSKRVAEQAANLGIRQIINCNGASIDALITSLKNHQAP